MLSKSSAGSLWSGTISDKVAQGSSKVPPCTERLDLKVENKKQKYGNGKSSALTKKPFHLKKLYQFQINTKQINQKLTQAETEYTVIIIHAAVLGSSGQNLYLILFCFSKEGLDHINLDPIWMAWSGFGQTDLIWK